MAGRQTCEMNLRFLALLFIHMVKGSRRISSGGVMLRAVFSRFLRETAAAAASSSSDESSHSERCGRRGGGGGGPGGPVSVVSFGAFEAKRNVYYSPSGNVGGG